MTDTLLSLRKNKIHLADFGFQKEIDNRRLLAQMSSLEAEILEEIFFSSSKLSLLKISRKFMTTPEKMKKLMQKFEDIQLLSIDDDLILVDKHPRKNLELYMQRFENEFEPDVEYLLSTLKTLPIHLLPVWYAIPRTSSDIFQSIIDKYLKTPYIYKRYLENLCFENASIQTICSMLLESNNLKLELKKIEETLSLSEEEMAKLLLYLEYSMICSVIYKDKIPFLCFYKEWKDYLLATRKSNPISSVLPSSSFTDPFAFVTHMEAVVDFVEKKAIKVFCQQNEILIPESLAKPLFTQYPEISKHLVSVVHKLIKLQLINVIDDHLYPSKNLKAWKKLNKEEKALHLYRTSEPKYKATYPIEKILRDVESNLMRLCHDSWISMKDFLALSLIGFSQEDLQLQQKGKNWSYKIPVYHKEEQNFIHNVIENYYFESGIVVLGTHENTRCFTLTSFGKKFLKTE